MKVLIQRVTSANVIIDSSEIAAIGKGFLLLIGIEKNDNQANAEYLAKKTANLRIFEDNNGKMNLSLSDVGGEILAVEESSLQSVAWKRAKYQGKILGTFSLRSIEL